MTEAGKELFDWVKTFAFVRRTEPEKLVFDQFSCEFCLVFDFEDAPESPESFDTCDVLIETLPHRCDDYVASRMRLLANAKKPDIIRLLGALKLRFCSEIRTRRL